MQEKTSKVTEQLFELIELEGQVRSLIQKITQEFQVQRTPSLSYEVDYPDRGDNRLETPKPDLDNAVFIAKESGSVLALRADGQWTSELKLLENGRGTPDTVLQLFAELTDTEYQDYQAELEATDSRLLDSVDSEDPTHLNFSTNRKELLRKFVQKNKARLLKGLVDRMAVVHQELVDQNSGRNS